MSLAIELHKKLVEKDVQNEEKNEIADKYKNLLLNQKEIENIVEQE
jgi:hypothetical protein